MQNDVVAIKAMRKGHKEVSVFFDKETGLLSKIEFLGPDIITGSVSRRPGRIVRSTAVERPQARHNDGMTVPDLPIAVRTVIVNWASETLGQLPSAQIPAGLVRVARFTPGAADIKCISN